MAEKNEKLTPFLQQSVETAKKILEYKLPVEANIVASIYKDYSILYNSNLTISDFNENVWKVYFQIAHDLITVEKKESLDDITIGIYLDKHAKLRSVYDESGGYEMIIKTSTYVDTKNFEAYVSELRKWQAVLRMIQKGYPVADRLSDIVDMTADEIYNEYEANLNSIFSNVESGVKSFDISDGIYDLIEKLDEGTALGLPYADIPTLTKETGGQCLGYITLVGGISNAGKSTFARSTTIPSIIDNDERIVIMINEDSFSKWQRELLVWVANNIFKKDTQKHIVRDGHYSVDTKELLYKSADWIIENTKNHKITIIPFDQYKTSEAIKQIRKYSALGVKYFMLDTFKMDAGSRDSNAWLQMQQAMVDIKDTIKEAVLNVHILITFQLEKGSSVMRYYTQNNVGMAKNIVDVASTCIMLRDVFDDEYADGNRPLKVYRPEGKNGATKVEVHLEKDKKYQVLFVVKNQEGAANAYQIVIEHDKSRNTIKEVGITNISPDF